MGDLGRLGRLAAAPAGTVDVLMWEELYSTYYKELLRYACGVCHSQTAAEDLVQEVFVKALQNTAAILDLSRSQTRAWLYRALKNLIVDQYRHQQVEDDYARSLNWEEAAGGEECFQKTEIRLLLLRLPEPDRTIFTLRYMEDYNATELAEMFGLPPGTIRAKLSRTRQQLKKMLLEK